MPIPDLSIIVPVYNEKKSLKELYAKIIENIPDNKKFEIVFVDDGSTDGTGEVLVQIKNTDENVAIVTSRCNKGKSAALTAGFFYATGEIAITLDGDLQDDPDEFQTLIQKLEEGYDVVTGWKFHRKDSPLRCFVSKGFNYFVYVITGCSLHDLNCGLKIIKKEVYKNMILYGDMHRFVPAIAYLEGFKVSECKVNHHPRKYGYSKYNVFRIRGILDLLSLKFLISYRLRPFHFFGVWGITGFFIGMIFAMVKYEDLHMFMLGLILSLVGIIAIFVGLITEIILNHALTQERGMILRGNVIERLSPKKKKEEDFTCEITSRKSTF